MPGIVGAIDFSGQARTDEIVAEACDILNRGGWYKVCKRSFGSKLSIARVHLDIFNREPQPFCDRKGKIFAFLEGEICLPDGIDNQGSNAQIEHVLELYQERGIDFASALNGSFVAAIYDSAKDLLIISTDRIASRPLFYAETATAFYFSPEIKAILHNGDVDRSLDQVTLASFLTNGYPVGDRTFFEHIKALKPATTMAIDIRSASINKHTYWEYAFDENGADRGEAHYVRELTRLLGQAVQRRIKGGHRIAILLSGGVDSRGILGFCLGKMPEINAVTWAEDPDKKDSDAAIAREICRRFDANHRVYRLDPAKLADTAPGWVYETEGATDTLGNYPAGLEIFEEMSREFDVALRGDELFGQPRSVRNEPAALFPAGIASSLDSQLKGVLRPHIYQSLEKRYKEEIGRISGECKLKDYNNRKDYYNYSLEMFRCLNPLSHYKQKRMELRNPWLDNDILDFTLKLPPKYRVNKRLYVRTLASAFPELMKLDRARGDNLPDWSKQFRQDEKLQDFVIRTLIQRGGDGFLELFDRDKLESFVRSYLMDSRLPVASLKGRLWRSIRSSRLWSSRLVTFLRQEAVHQILKRRKPGAAKDVLIMRLLILRLWYDQFRPSLQPQPSKS